MRRLLKFVLATLLLSSCAEMKSNSDSWKYDGPVNSCNGDGDCDYSVCDSKLSICVFSPPDQSEQLYVKIVPDSSADTPSQVFPVEIGPDGNATETLAVHTPVTVTGNTLAKVGIETQPLSARMIFSDVGNQLPGHPTRTYLYESDAEEVFDSLELLPGTYNIMIIPEGNQAYTCPVHYLDNVTLNTIGFLVDSDGNNIDLIVPSGVSTITGTVYQGDQPVDGLEIRAIDPETGRVVSTIAETSCSPPNPAEEICGDYSIEIAPNVTNFDLRITRYQEPHHPIIVKKGYTVPSEQKTEDIYLDPLGVPIRYQARVLRPVLTASGQTINDPASGNLVFFRSNDTGISGGKVEHWVTTNESGYLEETEGVLGINLYSGCYDMIIVPESITDGDLTDYGTYVLSEPVCITNQETQVDEYVLSTRPDIHGSVFAGGKKVPTSIILAQPVNATPGAARYNSTTTDNSGAFSFRLDHSDYIVFAEAPTESNYAWGTVPLAVDGDTSKSLELKIPYVANINVEPSADQAVPINISGSTVEWYRVINDKAYTVFRGFVDTNGESHALLEKN